MPAPSDLAIDVIGMVAGVPAANDFEKESAPELNDNYEELLELWERLKAK